MTKEIVSVQQELSAAGIPELRVGELYIDRDGDVYGESN